MIKNISNKFKLLLVLTAVLAIAGIVFEFIGMSAINRITILLIGLILAIMGGLTFSKLIQIKTETDRSTTKILEIDSRHGDLLNFSGKSHREILRRLEGADHIANRLMKEIEKQSRATREEARTNFKSLKTSQTEYDRDLKSEISQLRVSVNEISGYQVQLNDIEIRVRKLSNAYQGDAKDFREKNYEILELIRATNEIGVQNHDIIDLLERRIVNKLRINPELTNVRARVERMERRLIGLVERLRTESSDSFELVSGAIQTEINKINVFLASVRDEREESLLNQTTSLEKYLTAGNASIGETLNKHLVVQTDKWSMTVSELRSLSEKIELQKQQLDFKQLVSSLDTRSEDIASGLQHLEETLNARIQELGAEHGRLGEQTQTVNLSEETTAKLAEEYSRNSLHSRRQLRRHITETVRDSTRQMEALVKLAPRMAEVNPLVPPTGGYALDAQALLHLIDVLERVQPKVIVEFGGGTSTIWMAYICKKFGTRIISFDHLEEYLSRTRTEVERHGFSDMVELRLAPLEKIQVKGENYSWYSPAELDNLEEVDLLFIDGPPESTGTNARRPAMYVMAAKLNDDAVIVLDDTHRESEQDTVRDWTSSFPNYQVVDTNISRLTVLERSGEKN
ncbi:class I SAM-dependent methyltransferase [Glutamicibacter ardleyensis]|uniref:class I SAM-dependent methyltransferase n=1 Tax=Glutamicibacter ardleyensis TaxID=225894 RepID=UPI003FCFA106